MLWFFPQINNRHIIQVILLNADRMVMLSFIVIYLFFFWEHASSIVIKLNMNYDKLNMIYNYDLLESYTHYKNYVMKLATYWFFNNSIHIIFLRNYVPRV